MVDLLADIGRSPKPPEIQGTKIRFCNFIGFHIFIFIFSRQLRSLALSFLPNGKGTARLKERSRSGGSNH